MNPGVNHSYSTLDPHEPGAGSSYVSPHKTLLWLTALLCFIGLLAIYSASYLKGVELVNSPFYFLKKQSFSILLGSLGIIFLLYIPFSWIEKATLPIFVLTLILLSLVFIPGVYSKVGGANRWLNLGGLRFQPSELSKLAIVLFFAKYLAKKNIDINNFKSGLLPALGVFAIFALFLMKQPDFGTTTIMLLLSFSMFFVAGLRKLYIFSGIALAIMGLGGAIIVAPYRLKRLVSFLDPWGQFKEGGFQIIQSYLAFFNGGFFGAGLGNSQQKLYFLPEAHTDFILSVIGEELGLISIFLIGSIFMYIVFLGLQIARLQTLNYRKFLSFGLTCLIGLQAFVNFSVTMGLLPTKGLPLPFISSGSSSLLVFLACIGLLAKLAKELPPHEYSS